MANSRKRAIFRVDQCLFVLDKKAVLEIEMTRQEIERKRFWFRVKVITVFVGIVFISVKAVGWVGDFFKADENPTIEQTHQDTLDQTDDTVKDETVAVKEPTAVTNPYETLAYYDDQFLDRYKAYAMANASLSVEAVVTEVNMNLDRPFYDEATMAPALNQGSLMVLCNKYYFIPEDYKIDQLVSVPERLHAKDSKVYLLDNRALEAYEEMENAASSEGVALTIVSAHRTHDFQANLYDRYVSRNGKAEADTFSARPGYSEHETGLAVDLNQVDTAFEDTKAFAWLAENAHLYGFILRYPKGAENLTGYMYEPWHYRFVGKEVATQIKEEGITFDAYCATYLK